MDHVFSVLFGATSLILYLAICDYQSISMTKWECTLIDVRDDTCTQYSLIKQPKHERRVK